MTSCRRGCRSEFPRSRPPVGRRHRTRIRAGLQTPPIGGGMAPQWEARMELIDLSRDLFHRTQVHPSHPPVVITVWGDHSEKKVAGNTVFTSKALALSLSDHSGTHVDAPVHFDPRPGAASI